MPRIPIVDTVIEENGSILMIRRNFPPNKNKLDLPGGFVDKGETIKEAAIRETKEETGLSVKLIAELTPVDYFDRQEKTSYSFVGRIVGGKIRASEEGKPVWISIDKIKPQDLSFPTQFLPILKYYKTYKKRHYQLG